MIVDRVLELRRRRQSERTGSQAPQSKAGLRQRLEALEARVSHLESELEGLQDATHRQDVMHGRRIDELNRRTSPEEMARRLTADARRRGL